MAKSYRYELEDRFTGFTYHPECDECGRSITSNGEVVQDGEISLYVCSHCARLFLTSTNVWEVAA